MCRFVLAITMFFVATVYNVGIEAQESSPLSGKAKVDTETVTDLVAESILEKSTTSWTYLTNYAGCHWSPCVDAPRYIHCGQGSVMVGIDMPEFGGNEGSCNSSSITGKDDFRIRCCRVTVTLVK